MEKNLPIRLPQLDVLRFLAIFLVIGNHLTVCPPNVSPVFNGITGIWNRGGWIGVDLFFVLSGFLVSGLLFREYQSTESIDFKKFLIRRGFKIYPSFWVLILVTIFTAKFWTRDFSSKAILGELLFIQNYYENYWQHTWSLAVEEHFYFFLCLLFFVLLHARKSIFKLLPLLFISISIVCLIMRWMTAEYGAYNYWYIIEKTHLRIDSLFFGVLISYFWHFKNLSESSFLLKRKLFLGLVGILFLIPAFIFEVTSTFWLGVLGTTFLYLGSGLLLIVFLKLDFSNSAILKFLAILGTYSYSIYLWNMPIQYWFERIFRTDDSNWWLYASTYFMATFLVGIVMSKLIEYPVLKIRDKYFPSKTTIKV